MTEAGWTREKPTKNGWYWWRFDASRSATIVRIMVCGDGSLAEMSHNGHLLLAANFGGEWLGPLSPNDYQQGRVEGLREAAIICRERGKPHDIEWWMTASKKGVSAQTAIDCAELIEQLAQQAQEGGVGDY